MKLNLRLKILLALFLLVQPLLVAAGKAPDNPLPFIPKFSPGGKRLAITGDVVLAIFRINIQYCDRTPSVFQPSPYIIPVWEDFSYTDSKQMKKVQIFSTISGWNGFKDQYLITTISRGCNDDTPPAKLTCRDVQVPAIIHRQVKEPISFRSTRFVHVASLQFPGVDGRIAIEKAEANHTTQQFKPSL